MTQEFTLELPDDPAEAQAYLVGRLTAIAEERCHLSTLLDRQAIPTHRNGRPLRFGERVATALGFLEAASR